MTRRQKMQCEGCGERLTAETVRHDADMVPLCQECYEEIPVDPAPRADEEVSSPAVGPDSSTAERGEGEAASLEVPTQEVSREAHGGAVTFPAMPSSATVESELRAEVERLQAEVARLQTRVAGFRARRRR